MEDSRARMLPLFWSHLKSRRLSFLYTMSLAQVGLPGWGRVGIDSQLKEFPLGKVGWVSCCQPTSQHLGTDAPAGQGGLGEAPTASCLPKHHLSPFHQLPKALSLLTTILLCNLPYSFKSKVSSLLLHPLNLPTLHLTIEHLLHSAFFPLHPYPVSFKALR